VGYQVVLSRVAEVDLSKIVEYIARDDPAIATRFGRELIAHARRLEDFPRIGRVVPEFRRETLRELIHGSYRIVYQINDKKERIEITLFWHAARGIPEISGAPRN
jgi:plasmid stabilization system protein ParE